MQTQETFEKFLRYVVAQDDEKVLVKNMRTAVKTTNVVLNLVILPGLILIPLDLVFLKEKRPGYNNTLTMAMKEMKFGENENLNFEVSLEKVSKCRTRQNSTPTKRIETWRCFCGVDVGRCGRSVVMVIKNFFTLWCEKI